MKFRNSDAHRNIGNLVPADNEILLDKRNKRIVIGDGETAGGVQNTTSKGYYRAITSKYRRYFHVPMGSTDPGASGATFVPPDGNTIGGWQLDASTELLYFGADIHSDWDGESDITVDLDFECNVDNTGGGDTDTVDLKLVAYYKGHDEVVTKTQTVEVATVIGKSAQYKAFHVPFTIDWDKASNVVQAGDIMHFVLNLETDTSEVDNIIISSGGTAVYYNTKHAGVEDGDV
jgi:hypothetical protein